MSAEVPLKRLVSMHAGGTPDTSNEDYWQPPPEGTPWVAIGDMSGRSQVSSTAKGLSAEGLESKRLKAGSSGTVLFAMYASVGEVATLATPAAWNQALLGLVPIPGRCDARFLAYALRHIRPSLAEHYRSNTQDNLNADQVANLRIPAPPLAVQVRVADFLDLETAKIDALIAKQQQLVERLREDAAARIRYLINETNAPVEPLKRHWSVTDCKHLTAEFIEDGWPLASIGEVKDEFVDLSQANRTSHAFFEQLIEGDRAPQEDDLIFSRNATVGAVARVPRDTEPFAMGQDVCLLRRLDRRSSASFLRHVLVSRIGQEQIELAMIGSTFRRINIEGIRELRLPSPTADDQHRMATQMDAITAKMQALTRKADELIAAMKERRAALITAAVTGQLDVATYGKGA